ncbi:MAG: bifunctional [glutamate--ammonia ligase]-adenylyl-L-tyrosine phosphorylase/[glutamate--ammonia-ligase] adenylyltransferase [Pseudomonadota bacterium]
MSLPSSPTLRWVLGLSTFAERVARQQPDWLQRALAGEAFNQPVDPVRLRDELAAIADAVDTPEELHRGLRRLRNRIQFTIVSRHLTRRAPLEETIATLSTLADAAIDAALTCLTAWAEAKSGVPRNAAGERQRLTVLALGKLGASELNLSSDVDVIFVYGASGKTDQGLTNEQFFLRLGQQLIAALDRLTEDGFVFRTDLRLRPFGASGPLVIHGEAFADYYLNHGRDWERYALQKARACAGDRAFGERLLDDLRFFVYRRYVDFGMLEALRTMKASIQREHGDAADIKLGPGGIRDVEFTVQALQLIWGGREPVLQTGVLTQALTGLTELGLFDTDAADELRRAYRQLRDVEHSLQAIDDQQTQRLPADDEARLRIALSLGYTDLEAFDQALAAERATVSRHFAELIALPEVVDVAVGAPAEVAASPSTTAGAEANPTHPAALSAAGFNDPEGTADALAKLSRARDRNHVDAVGRERLNTLLPIVLELAPRLSTVLDQRLARDDASPGLLSALCGSADLPDRAVQRVVPILMAVLRRSAYLALLLENTTALRRLLLCCAASRWLAERLAQRPALLDALLDERQQGVLPDRAALKEQLAARLTLANGDDERWFAELKAFKEDQQFAAAFGQVRGSLPLMKTSDCLTFLAEAVICAAFERARGEFCSDRGWPFLVLGFGKLGGIELGPESDLDLVFVHDLSADDGPVLQRFCRSLLSIIGTPTAQGPLYEVDTRLRPSGSAGTMVTQIDAFERYQFEQAWTWEHQALIRARPICGDPALAERFQAIRRRVLGQLRDRERLRDDVLTMHRRLRRHGRQSATDIKRASGGIVDIEFLVQHLVLAESHAHPSLLAFPDNVRILEASAAAGVLDAAAAARLTEAYLALRTEGHRAALDLPDAAASAAVLAGYRDRVAALWEERFGVPLDEASRL